MNREQFPLAMKTFTVQIDGTNPKNWRSIEASDAFDAIAKVLEPVISQGHNPKTAYVVRGKARHDNGAPMCVQSYILEINHL